MWQWQGPDSHSEGDAALGLSHRACCATRTGGAVYLWSKDADDTADEHDRTTEHYVAFSIHDNDGNLSEVTEWAPNEARKLAEHLLVAADEALRHVSSPDPFDNED